MHDDAAFLEQYDPTEFDRPTVAVDVVLLTASGGSLQALLMRRNQPPFSGHWALPGVIVGMEESLDEAALRALRTRAGIDGAFLEQLYTFGAPARDPRTRVLTVAYYALVAHGELAGASGAGADRALAPLRVAWDGEVGGPVDALDDAGAPRPLAFDHADILGATVRRLRGKLDYSDIGFELLPRRFPLRELQAIHETILGRPLNKDSFRRRMQQSGLVTATGVRETDTPYRPAELFEFARRPAPVPTRTRSTS